MGIIGRFEKGLDRAVNGVFAKAFRSEVQPLEIASALRRELDDRAQIISRELTIAPNVFVVELGPSDHQRLRPTAGRLCRELGGEVAKHAGEQRYTLDGSIQVSLVEAADLDTGVFRVNSSSRADAGRPPAPMPGQYPGHQQAHQQGHQQVQQAGRPPAPVPHPAAAPPLPSSPPVYGQPSLGTPAPAAPSLDVEGRIHRITSSVTVIGRSADADVVLDDAGISRRHAEVHLIDGRARVIDLGSTNGTYVDGERVHAGNLTEGSTITIGRTRIVYHGGQW